MAATRGVGKLRQVIDYWDCETCLKHSTPEQDYFCAVCKRLQRDVAVTPRLVAAPVRRTATKSDAVRVVPPEEWAAAQEARRRAEEQEVELAQLQLREQDLLARVQQLQDELATMRGESPPDRTGRRVPWELVGVRKPAESLEFLEEFEEIPEESLPPPEAMPPQMPEPVPPPPRFEVVPEPEAAPEPEPEPAREAAREAAGWEVEGPEPGPPTAAEPPETVDEEGFVQPPPIAGRRGDDIMRQVEEEIAKIEEELSDLSRRERDLQKTAVRGPRAEAAKAYKFQRYTLYARSVPVIGQAPRTFYFFSREVPPNAVPVPLPPGYTAAKHPKTGLPYLKKAGAAGEKGRRRKR